MFAADKAKHTHIREHASRICLQRNCLLVCTMCGAAILRVAPCAEKKQKIRERTIAAMRRPSVRKRAATRRSLRESMDRAWGPRRHKSTYVRSLGPWRPKTMGFAPQRRRARKRSGTFEEHAKLTQPCASFTWRWHGIGRVGSLGHHCLRAWLQAGQRLPAFTSPASVRRQPPADLRQQPSPHDTPVLDWLLQHDPEAQGFSAGVVDRLRVKERAAPPERSAAMMASALRQSFTVDQRAAQLRYARPDSTVLCRQSATPMADWLSERDACLEHVSADALADLRAREQKAMQDGVRDASDEAAVKLAKRLRLAYRQMRLTCDLPREAR